MTVFSRTGEHAPGYGEYEELPMAQKLQISHVAFDGQVRLEAYLTRNKNGELSCIPLNGTKSLPILFPGDDGYSARELDGCFESADGTKLYYHTELPQVRLNNPDELDLSEYFGDKDYVKVELTLDNVTLTYSRPVETNCGIIANIAGISDYVLPD